MAKTPKKPKSMTPSYQQKQKKNGKMVLYEKKSGTGWKKSKLSSY